MMTRQKRFTERSVLFQLHVLVHVYNAAFILRRGEQSLSHVIVLLLVWWPGKSVLLSVLCYFSYIMPRSDIFRRGEQSLSHVITLFLVHVWWPSTATVACDNLIPCLISVISWMRCCSFHCDLRAYLWTRLEQLHCSVCSCFQIGITISHMNANETKRGEPLAPTNIRCDIKLAESAQLDEHWLFV